MRNKIYLAIKRGLDIVISLIGLLIASPILIIASIAIVIDDPTAGPIYAQKRIGKNGKPFTMYKLRTMVKNAEEQKVDLRGLNEMDGPVFKITEDPRITKAGKLLRKTNLDELPQLFNVLKGDMALVGPRPPLPDEVESYHEWHKERLSIKPGVTCYWQIAKDRNSISFHDWVMMDLKYKKDMSLWTDLKILFGTVRAVLTMSGK